LKYQNVNFPDGLFFECKNCGRCCKEQAADVTKAERKRIEELGFRNFLDRRDFSEPRVISRRSDGGCFFLNDDNSCKIHGVKPEICRLVPFLVVDWDYERDVIEVDLPADCACPGISVGEELPFEKLTKAAQNYVKETIELLAEQEGLPPKDPKVLSETRKLIIRLALGCEV
jgi:Fe-S-cluster containining protein